MKILYIFPHPDDETFGPAPAIVAQKAADHSVYLLTLTRGGATKQRLKYNYSIEEMGQVRWKEMLAVKEVLDLDGLTILDLPDSGLKELDPDDIERVIETEIKKLAPHIIVTYAVHGISGFHDHLVGHAAVKSVYCRCRRAGMSDLKRLAFFTLNEAQSKHPAMGFKVNFSKPEEIDCCVPVTEAGLTKFHQALDCYATYGEVIKSSGIRQIIQVNDAICFEFFQESFQPPLTDLTAGLK